MNYLLQQYLPFTVLKLAKAHNKPIRSLPVATVLTVYGIETVDTVYFVPTSNCVVATVLTVYGIETADSIHDTVFVYQLVATVLTVYGIETASC